MCKAFAPRGVIRRQVLVLVGLDELECLDHAEQNISTIAPLSCSTEV